MEINISSGRMRWSDVVKIAILIGLWISLTSLFDLAHSLIWYRFCNSGVIG